MTVKRPTKPASVATPEEVNRVAVMSNQELAEAAPYSIIDPISIPEIKIWLRVDQATSDVNGVSSVPDAKGGSAATQSTNAQKPTLGTTGNGLAKLTCVDDCLVLPIQAGFNNSAWFGMAMWIRPSNVSTSSDLFNVTTASGATVNKLSFRQSSDDLLDFTWASNGSDTRQARTGSAGFGKAILAVNIWTFVSMEFDGTQATEDTKNQFKLNGTPVPAPNATQYSNGVGAIGSPGLSALNTPTGNSLLFARTTAGGNPFQGDIGPDIFFYDPRTITAQKLVQAAQFRVPVG